MSKKFVKIMCLVLCLVVSFIFILVKYSTKKNILETTIVNYANENYTDAGLEMRLTDFTNFEWDKVVIFRNPVSVQEISTAIGVDYTKSSLDLMSGMIFVYKDKIVYQEMFKGNYNDKISPFMIYPNQDINNEQHFRVFTQNDALFKCVRKEYDKNYNKMYDKKHDFYYRFYPTS